MTKKNNTIESELDYTINVAIRKNFKGPSSEVEKQRKKWLSRLRKEHGSSNVDITGFLLSTRA